MIEICKKESCSGCFACLNICPKKAIKTVPDILGFMYPEINRNLCIDCGLCQKVCPVIHPQVPKKPERAFAAYSTDVADRMSSTSGGAASVFSQYVIRQGGVVYGCSGEDCMHVRHIRVAEASELAKLKGSKYVQSDIGSVLKSVKSDLQSGRFVLFIGTPCQIAGLNGFLCKEYDNLLTIDLVCHGVPSQQLLNDAMKYYAEETRLSKASILFRKKGKDVKDLRYGLYVSDQRSSSLFSANFPFDHYITGFMSGLFFRENCYHCPYAAPQRISDITLGDFWGLGGLEVSRIKQDHGISLVLINTPKGTETFEKCSVNLTIEERQIREAILGNGQLQHPLARNKYSDRFRELYPYEGFKESCRLCLKEDYKRFRNQQIKKHIISLIAHIPFSKQCYHVIKDMLCLKKSY